MKRNALLTLVCCLVMGVAALVAAPSPAMAIPYHATDSELQGTAYAVLNPTTGEFDFVRSTEPHENKSVGTVKSISGGSYTGTIYTGFETGWCDWYPIASSVKSVRFVDAARPTGTAEWFEEMGNCTTMDLSRLDTSQVMMMTGMFYGCSALTSLDVLGFDTSQVCEMAGMFQNWSSLTSLDVSSFDTSQVTNELGMWEMFSGCSSLTSLDLSSFDTSQVTNMSGMFDGCTSLNKITFGDKFVIN